jgi:hypothetical protein
MSDRHAEYEWQQQALQGRPRPIAPAPIRTPLQRPATGLRSTLAILALSLVAAGLWLVLHAGVGCS